MSSVDNNVYDDNLDDLEDLEDFRELNVNSFFNHLMTSREGIVSSALKIQDNGYIQRKFVKMLEDIKQEYDGTVRNANGKVISCVYGGNSIYDQQDDQ
ncbi:DNA-directed RNA polymerase subunit 1 [Acanthamoeba polyphaga mimivirus]|uniref:DNA-directed RNA polymerase n=1 Tax=Acanthamoeba polyphaga mimivirus Kroon TaxID=3069720 RepID=A0A0G2Y487_9VIRU|nr:DNA-directed RNA polymerase subunit 1 [Acanthamoeba polyphaga mimivirus]AKI80618.1 DNA-directed RNA polymerase subunit 1 [Acanthamoeba polyphaga mimivirus Kroon]